MEHHNKEFCLEVWGDYACFTRPEMKVERVSYEVITPSAARAIFEAILWKPAIRWQVTRIEVINPIKWTSVRRNEVGKTASPRTEQIFIEDGRQQRASLFLKDVRYRLYAQLEYIPPHKRKKNARQSQEEKGTENPAKYNSMFERRASKGQCFNQPYFGCREFSVHFKYIENPVKSTGWGQSRQELGFMLYDMDFADPKNPRAMFYRPMLDQGVIEVPPFDSKEIYR